jgi:toxin ParE1/3/4
MAHVLAPEAAAQLDDIWYYVATESGSVERADRFVEAITKRFYRLSRYPRLGRLRDDLRPGLWSFPAGDYVIVYRLTQHDDVLILIILHSRQDLNKAMLG